MRLLPASPRRRRLLARLSVLPVVAGGIAALVLLSKGTPPPPAPVARPAPPELARAHARPARRYRLTSADRREIDRVLDVFVPSALAREHPLRSYTLASPHMRSGTTRAQWAEGNLPVMTYVPRGRRFHGWTVNAVLRNHVSIDLLIQSGRRSVGNVAFTIELVRRHGGWLVDSFLPTAFFAPEAAPVRNIRAAPDYSPQANTKGSAVHGRWSGTWLLVPVLGIGGLIVAIPFGAFAFYFMRARKAERAYRRATELRGS